MTNERILIIGAAIVALALVLTVINWALTKVRKMRLEAELTREYGERSTPSSGGRKGRRK